jgi:carbon storage regulator
MLIIGRRAGESIWIGDEIEIKVVDVTPSRVSLGLAAPRQWRIRRGEVRQAEEANRAAAALRAGDLERLMRSLGRVEGRSPADLTKRSGAS